MKNRIGIILIVLIYLGQSYQAHAQLKTLAEGEIVKDHFFSASDMEQNNTRIKEIFKPGKSRSIDTRYKVHTLRLADTNRYILYYEELKEGIETSLAKILASEEDLSHRTDSITEAHIQSNQLKRTTRNLERTEYVAGHKCDVYEVVTESNSSYRVTTYWLSTEYDGKVAGSGLPNGKFLKRKIDDRGDIERQKYVVVGTITKKEHFSTYILDEVKKLEERPVSDAEFAIPEDIKIAKINYWDLYSKKGALDKKNKALIKKKYPKQKETYSSYDMDESWED